MTAWEVRDRMKQHMEEAKKYFHENNIVGLFLQGSQNYKIDLPTSDVDTKLIITPTISDFTFNARPVSKTHVMENGEHIDFKDVRLYIDTFRQQNMNFIEILFTDYFIINPLYIEPWGKLVEHRESIAHYNKYRAVQAMMGIATRQYKRVTNKAESNAEMFDSFGYDPKALANLLRMSDFLWKYAKNLSYKECMIPFSPDYIKKVKTGYFYPHEAAHTADVTYNAMKAVEDICKQKFKNEVDKETEKLLIEVQKEIMDISIKKELKV